MSISAMLGGTPSSLNSGGLTLPPISSVAGSVDQGTVPPPQQQQQPPQQQRTSPFLVQTSDGNPTFQLPPVAFSNSVDRRRQNLEVDTAPARAEDAMARLKKLSTARAEESLQQQQQQDAGYHHHHHHHRHHHHHHEHSGDDPNSHVGTVVPTGPETQDNKAVAASTITAGIHDDLMAGSVEPPATIKSSVIVNNTQAIQAAEVFGRQSLGCILYEENTNVLLPRLDENINCTIQIRIPHQFLNKYNEGIVKRKLWGTDIYTDESDIVAVLYHCGILKLEEERESRQNDEEENENKEDETSEQGRKETQEENQDPEPVQVATPQEPKHEDEGSSKQSTNKSQNKDQDCVATLLILPTLEKYVGSCRNGLNSRTWSSLHDGVSFQVIDAQFQPCGSAESTSRCRKRRIEGWCQLRSQFKKSRRSIYWHENEFL